MVSSDRDYDDDPPRSIFAALWFRALVVILVLGIIAAVAVPYVLDVVNPPTKPMAKAPVATPPAVAPSAPSTPPTATSPPSPSTPAPPPTAAPVPKPSEPAMPAEPAKPTDAPKMAEPPKAVDAPKAAEPTKRAPGRVAAATPTRTAAAGGPYWVQVGAFKDQATAKRVAEQLRDQKYKVEESAKAGGRGTSAAASPTPAPATPSSPSGGSGDLYDVFVSGTTAPDINARLSGKGMSAQGVAGGVIVKPSLPLRDAVALSRDLAADGLKVQVRRAGGGVAQSPAPSPAAPAGSSADTLHRVRVGSYPDRATAQSVVRELESKGYKPFIARGTE